MAAVGERKARRSFDLDRCEEDEGDDEEIEGFHQDLGALTRSEDSTLVALI